MNTAALKERARLLTLPIARLLVRLGLGPNAVTVIGFLLNVGVALIIASGYLIAGGVLVLFAGWFDMLDGAVARLTQRATLFGSFLDSTLDRYSEAAVLLGLLIHLAREGQTVEVVLAYVAIVGSLMVSYARARAEGLGLQCEVGMLARPERIVLTSVGLIFNLITPVLWILAVFTNVTAVQRVLHIYRITTGDRHASDNGREGER